MIALFSTPLFRNVDHFGIGNHEKGTLEHYRRGQLVSVLDGNSVSEILKLKISVSGFQNLKMHFPSNTDLGGMLFRSSKMS